MKTIQSIIIIVAVIINSFPAISAEWASIPGTTSYFDKSRIRIDNKGNIWIWEKSITPDDLIKEKVKKLSQIGSHIDYTNYSYSIEHWVINCKEESHALKSGVDYAEDGGRVISSFDLQNINFRPVIPDSLGEKRLRAICDLVSKGKTKKKKVKR